MEFNSTFTPLFTLDQLLSLIGIGNGQFIIYGYIMPILALIGSPLCLLNIIIFFKKKFSTKCDFYFRIINCFNLFSILFAIPGAMCLAPKYFPKMNTFACAIVTSVYLPYVHFNFHFIGVLEIIILLERIKLFDPFVQRYFKISCKKMAILSLLISILVNTLFTLVNEPAFVGNFYYDSGNGEVKVNQLYLVKPSALSESKIGFIVLVANFAVRDALTLIVGLILSIISFVKMKLYYNKRQAMFIQNNITPSNQSTNANPGVSNFQDSPLRRQKKSGKNYLYMSLTFCSINIASRSLSIVCDVYFLVIFNQIALYLGTFLNLIFLLRPCISFFVFYFFNRKFRKEFRKMVFSFIRCR